MKKITFTILIALTTASAALGQRELSLSIYNNNFAMIKDTRVLNFEAGVNEFNFTDVANTIEPTSVRFQSLDDPDAQIVEQNFQFDLVSSSKVLKKYIGKSIEILTTKGDLLTGKLLRPEESQIILQNGDDSLRIIQADQIASVKLTKLPQGLLTKPTLMWQMYSPNGGEQKIQLDYLAKQIKWTMNYNAVLAGDEKTLSIDGWVTLTNNTSTAFPNANVTLLAGSPNRDYQYHRPTTGVAYLRSISSLEPSKDRGDEISETFGEYHLYRLPKPSTVNANQIKQIKMLKAVNVPVEKLYFYDGAATPFIPTRRYTEPNFGKECNKKINVLLAIDNTAKSNLGVALPSGLTRIFKRDSDKSLEFIGEDTMPATPVNQRVMLYIGDAFDITGERTQTNFKRISDHVIEESFKIELKNHKDTPIKIMTIEKLYRWSDWEILSASSDYKKIDSRTIHFDMPIQPDETKIIEYTVRYRW